MFKNFWKTATAILFSLVIFSIPALAQDGRIGMAEDKQINFQPPATEVMEQIIDLHVIIMWIITAIIVLVTGLILWIVFRYNRRANPTPSKTTHSTLLELIWTVIPILILFFLGYHSIKLLYKQDVIPPADMVIKVTGHQWYWTYEYPDHNGLTFDAYMVPEEYSRGVASADVTSEWDAIMEELRITLGREAPIKTMRLLDTDTRMVVPVNTTVKVLVTADDVIHAWTIPAFGSKIDAVPGRINETWFNAYEIGTYYGQCSELCGIKHAFMPIVVEVVSREDFEAWVIRASSPPAR